MNIQLELPQQNFAKNCWHEMARCTDQFSLKLCCVKKTPLLKDIGNKT